MKKVFAFALAMALSLSLLAGCGGNGNSAGGTSGGGSTAAPEGGGQLNLYTWEGMFSNEFLRGFEQSSGYTVNYINFDTDETMLTRLVGAEGGDYDLIISDEYIIESAIELGLVQKLDTARLENYGNINPLYQGQYHDPNDEYTVPLGAGVMSIVYNPANVDMEITGYADLWDESLQDRVGIVANYRVINGMALKVLGESYNTDDLDSIEAAGAKLQELAPNIRLIKDDNLQNDLLTGEIDVAYMYTSQVTEALLADPSLEVVYPSEGIGFGLMPAFIPSNAPNADAAYAFLDYILEAENAAEYFMNLGYFSTISAADPYIDESMKSFLTLPDSISIDDAEMIENVSAEADELHNKIWTEFKTATGQ